MASKKEEISKLISYWLRHNPADANLVADEFGWVILTGISSALKTKGHEISNEYILELNLSFDKIRWEIDLENDKIRATHGHSFSVLLDEKIEKPPKILYHGTAISNLESIILNGLKPIKRQFVHLSTNIETAIEVGKRHGKPVIICVDAESLELLGFSFYKTSDDIWLTSEIQPIHLDIEPWHSVNFQEKNSLLNELKIEISNNHILFDKINNLELIMRRYDRDDCLFKDYKTGRVYLVHLTWSMFKEPDPHYPRTNTYESIMEWITQDLYNDQIEWYNS